MIDLMYIIKGFMIGVIVSIPIGPILILSLQKSVNDGRKAGFSCGLGATVVDTACAIVSAFALSAIGDIVEKNTSVIELAGGLLISFIGFNIYRTRIQEQHRKRPYSPKNFVKAMTMGFSNPAALAVMLAMFASFKMDMSEVPAVVTVLTIFAVSAGSVTYWYYLTKVVAHFGDKFNFKVLLTINRIAGAGIMAFGLYLTFKGITALLHLM